MPIKLTSIDLKNGGSFKPTSITVIVGANNSGKTRFLKELDQYIKGSSATEFEYLILKAIKTEKQSFDELIKVLGFKVTTIPEGNSSYLLNEGFFDVINLSSDQKYINTIRLDMEQMAAFDVILFRKQFGKALTAFVQTENRLTAAKSSKYDDNGLLTLFYNKGAAIEELISIITSESFGLNIKLDYTEPGKLSIRVGEDFSNIPSDPRDARALLRDFQLMEEQGDGLRSFVTTLLFLMLTHRPIILIDEPEAFLHPPQAATLGSIVSDFASATQSVLIATHSADFLRGVITQRQDINILRLTRNENGTTGHVVDAKEILKIINSPILNSKRVLDGLFYQGVVIMEGDSDRTFYEKIATTYFGSDEILYIHAQNKQTIYKIIAPYVKASVKFAVIVDFDILRDRADLKRILETAGKESLIDTIIDLQTELQQHINIISNLEKYKVLVKDIIARVEKENEVAIEAAAGDKDLESEARSRKLKSDFNNFFDESDKWSVYKRKGRAALSNIFQEKFDKLNGLCESAGIFIVHCGSLESWLEYHGIPSSANNKANWIANALSWLNENFPEPMPAKDFIEKIHKYIVR